MLRNAFGTCCYTSLRNPALEPCPNPLLHLDSGHLQTSLVRPVLIPSQKSLLHLALEPFENCLLKSALEACSRNVPGPIATPCSGNNLQPIATPCFGTISRTHCYALLQRSSRRGCYTAPERFRTHCYTSLRNAWRTACYASLRNPFWSPFLFCSRTLPEPCTRDMNFQGLLRIFFRILYSRHDFPKPSPLSQDPKLTLLGKKNTQ